MKTNEEFFDEWLAKEIKATSSESFGRTLMSLAEDYKEVFLAACEIKDKEIERLKYELNLGVELLNDASKEIGVLDAIKNSGLFQDVHFGEAYQVHLSAMKDKQKLIRIAERHSLGVLFYALYSLGFKAGTMTPQAFIKQLDSENEHE